MSPSATTNSTKAPDGDLTDQAVLDYLRKRGMSAAVMELSKQLKGDEAKEKSTRERLEADDLEFKNQKALLTRTTGASYGYDRDSSGPVLNWLIPDHEDNVNAAGIDEARAYVDAFVSLQLWVLGLPDEGFQGHTPGTLQSSNPLLRTQALIKSGKDVTISSVIQELMKPTEVAENMDQIEAGPPSIKPELLSVTFALFIYTYFELLEVGMESTALMIRDVFKPIYEPKCSEELKDLNRCTTTAAVVELSKLNMSHSELVSKLKSWFIKISKYEHELSELTKKKVVDPQQQQQKDRRIGEYKAHIAMAKQKYSQESNKATVEFEKTNDLPFLRRAKALRWQITLSNTSYTTLWSFLNNRDSSLLPMITLLQTKCELHIEKREPLAVTPASVLLDDSGKRAFNANDTEINWAAPVPQGLKTIFKNDKIPFPKYKFQEEYEDEKSAAKDKRVVEFNRATLINGFRRLEALERKREFDGLSAESKKRVKEEGMSRHIADPFQPSILMSTLAADSPTKAVPVTNSKTDVATIWEESGIGICCAKLSQPDGRRIAAGCDDAAVRIWSMAVSGNAEPSQVLIGHKEGLPVFDVDWNRDGRSLLSAGGDGSVRLWDTLATGPIGETAPRGHLPPSKAADIEADVPGYIAEAKTVKHGAELAVYRGHTPGSCVWSVSYAPSGYYFVTGGADATARLWTTDRNAPVRLFAGHTSDNVNCVTWHPNCNYVLSGADDKTVRLWDVHTGRTVRLLTGCRSGIHSAKVSPSGRYAAASDFRGSVYLWDLGTGKLVTEMPQGKNASSLIHSLAFSACGSALATGGEDCCIKIWDVRKDFISEKAFVKIPNKSFETKRTMVMDLCFSRRNLLLAAGKVLIPTQVAPSTS